MDFSEQAALVLDALTTVIGQPSTLRRRYLEQGGFGSPPTRGRCAPGTPERHSCGARHDPMKPLLDRKAAVLLPTSPDKSERASPVSTLSAAHSKQSSSESLEVEHPGHAMQAPCSAAGGSSEQTAAPSASISTQSTTAESNAAHATAQLTQGHINSCPLHAAARPSTLPAQAAALLDPGARQSADAPVSTMQDHQRSIGGGTCSCPAPDGPAGRSLLSTDTNACAPGHERTHQPHSQPTPADTAAGASRSSAAPAVSSAGPSAPPPRHTGPTTRPSHLGRTQFHPPHSLPKRSSSGIVTASTAVHDASLPLRTLSRGNPSSTHQRTSAAAAVGASAAAGLRGASSHPSRAPLAPRNMLESSPSAPLVASSSSDECEEATRRITAAFPRLHAGAGHERHKSWSVLGGGDLDTVSPRQLRSQQGSHDGSGTLTQEDSEALERRRHTRRNYHLMGQAAVELFLRVNHARQTLDFAKRQASLFATLDRAVMDVWEALDLLNELREYQAALVAGSAQVDPDLPLKDHAFQTAELCRLAHPEHDWLHLVGLIHGLGKLLAHRDFGSQPQWATCGESFPLGCRFDPSIQGCQFFSANPDRRRRLYNSPLGIYTQGCGLQNVFMSWSAAEYLYLLLLLNGTLLPPEALFIIRHQRFYSLTSSAGAYRQLLSTSDEAVLPLLASFQQLSAYRRVMLPPDQALGPQEFRDYYQALIDKYIGKDRKLSW